MSVSKKDKERLHQLLGEAAGIVCPGNENRKAREYLLLALWDEIDTAVEIMKPRRQQKNRWAKRVVAK